MIVLRRPCPRSWLWLKFCSFLCHSLLWKVGCFFSHFKQTENVLLWLRSGKHEAMGHLKFEWMFIWTQANRAMRVMSNYLSWGETFSCSSLSPAGMCEKAFVRYGENEICPLYVFLPPQHHYCPPYRVSGWFWTDRVCSPRTRGSRWCTQVPRSPTREERGAVLMCTGPLGALADEGLGCRRALKNVRGFWDKTEDTLGMLWPLTPARWPLCFVLWPEIGAYMWRDTGRLIANPKVSCRRRLQYQLLYTYAHVCPLYSGVIGVSIAHVVMCFPVLSATSGANCHHYKNKGWRRVWMLSSSSIFKLVSFLMIIYTFDLRCFTCKLRLLHQKSFLSSDTHTVELFHFTGERTYWYAKETRVRL